MSGILRLESLTKGNTLKQGDQTPLKYRLFDADGEKLTIAGKSAKVRLVYPDFLTIGYEKDGLTVAQDDTVTFTIDTIIPSRIYHVEIIVDDKFIFPSRADESKFTVDKSSLGTEANIIEIVGVDQIVNKVLGRVDADIGQAVTDINATNEAIQQAEQERKQWFEDTQITLENVATYDKLNYVDGTEAYVEDNEIIVTHLSDVQDEVNVRLVDEGNNLYYVSGELQSNSSEDNVRSVGLVSDSVHNHSGDGKYMKYSFAITSNGTSNNFFRFLNSPRSGAVPEGTLKIRNTVLINLTQAFGVGKEPSVELMDYLMNGLGYFSTHTLTLGDILRLVTSPSDDGDQEDIDTSALVNEVLGYINPTINGLTTRMDNLETEGVPAQIDDGTITPEKTSFLEVGKNLFDKSTVTPLTTIITNNGNIAVSSRNGTSEPIRVKEQTDYFMSDTQGSTVTVAFFKSDKSFISSVQQAGNTKFTTPPLTDYLIVAVRDDKWETFQLEEGGVGTPYEPYGYKLNESIGVTIDDTNFLKRDIFKKQLPLVDGSISSTGDDAIGPNRVRTLGFVDISAGSTLTLKDPQSYQVAIYDEKDVIKFSWSSEKVQFLTDTRIRLMIRTTPTERNVTIEEAHEQINIRTSQNVALLSDVGTGGGGGGSTTIINGVSEVVKYVSLLGLDTNNGDTLATGYATLQKAVESGATTVYVERGDYYNQRFTASTKRLNILPADDPVYDSAPVKKIRFIGADKLNNLIADGTIYSQTFATGKNFKAFFTDRTLDLTTGGTRPQYNVLLWEVFADHTRDYVMKPVLTLAEVQAEQGTFFWDGTKIYVNPTDSDSQFFVPTHNVGLDFSKVERLTATDVVSDFYIMTPFNLDKVTRFDLQNCEANHSGYSDGFSVDYASGVFNHCIAYKNRNDGYNMHFHGDTVLINCYGLDNYDDGVSHHEHTTGTIIGGEFSRNGKAGSAPVADTKVNMYDVWLEGNDYGILSSRASEGNIYKGNIIKGNRVGISNNVENTRFVDNKLIGNETEFVGTVEQI